MAPAWLQSHAQPEWVDRYERRATADRQPTTPGPRLRRAETTGADGYLLLAWIWAADAPGWLHEVPAVERLCRVWIQNFVPSVQGGWWRTEEDGLPPALLFVASPNEDDARYERQYTTSWVGYKVRLSETCEADSPRLITNVVTTPAPVADGAATPLVHQALQDKGLLPAIHLVDSGYLDAELLVASRLEYGVDLLGPARPDVKWQARAGQGFDAQSFAIDRQQQQAIRLEGHTSISWTPAIDNRHTAVIRVKFSIKVCQPCPSRSQCIRSRKRYQRRTITIRPKDAFLALRARRERALTPASAAEYTRRAGIEGTISQSVRVLRLRRSRYFGAARTHLSYVLTATGLNFLRVANWLARVPRAGTRQSPFATLMAGLAHT